MRLNKGIPTLPSLFHNTGSGVLGGPTRFRHQASGFNVPPIEIILLFYFFIFLKKKITGTLEQIGQQYIKSLKLQDKIEVKCSETVKYARTIGIKHFFTYDF